MSLNARDFLRIAVIGGLLSIRSGCAALGDQNDSGKRPVTVADAITMMRVAGSAFPSVHPHNGFAVFSPNGKYFAVVLAKGNLERNANDYSLELFRSADISRNERPRLLTTFASSSNRAGIFDVRWLEDNDTILFLGSRGESPTELYSIQASSSKLKKLTNHEQSLVSYGTSRNGDEIVYAAERPERRVPVDRRFQSGYDVSTERPADLIRGRISNWEPEIFLQGRNPATEKRLRTMDPFDSGLNDLFLSPDGRYLVVKTDITNLKEAWRQYNDESVHMAFRRGPVRGVPTRVLHYELIDTRTGESHVLLDAPATFSPSDVLWSPNSSSLILSGTYLPLDVKDPAELQARRTNRFVVEVDIASLRFMKITTESLTPIEWNPKTNVVEFRTQQPANRKESIGQSVYYRKRLGVWERLARAPEPLDDGQLDILVEEDMNRPPRMMVVNPKSGRESLLLDLNPGFARLALAGEREMQWTSKDGNALNAGLYLPADYKPGDRYPLVIQTHGFDPNEFWVDGPYTTAFAAQPLASRGIAVLQMNDIFFETMETPQEMQHVMDAYESAIDYLDMEGFIDPGRVGLIGFSRTCMYVKYALTHSRKHFAAAIVSDGVDAGYFQYLLSYKSNPSLASDFEAVIGASPFGSGLSLWLKNSPGFLLDRVETPLLIEPVGPSSMLGEWQWFAGLNRLAKPVDMIYLPGGTHILVKPWDRMTSQQTTVDWFCFWLKGEEDRSVEKANEYSLWRKLRAQAKASVQR